MTAATKAFDPAVTSPTGDLWLASLNPSYSSFNPVVLLPGASATVNVTITPSAAPGTVVSGALYIGTYDTETPPYYGLAGDEAAALPYTYRVK
jgi:hypothetical protein